MGTGPSTLSPGPRKAAAGAWAFSHAGCTLVLCCCFTCHIYDLSLHLGCMLCEGKDPGWYQFCSREAWAVVGGKWGVLSETW